MGQIIPKPPVEYGNDCPSCTPGRWPVGETPKYVYCMFWDVVGCGVSPNDPPNGVVFRMVQQPGNPCLWLLNGSVWRPDFQPKTVGPGMSQLRLLDSGGFSFFIGTSFPCRPEYQRYTNSQAACIFAFAGSAGFGTAWWNDDVTDIITELGLQGNGKLFYELFMQTGVFEVHKFTSLYYRTNIKVKHV